MLKKHDYCKRKSNELFSLDCSDYFLLMFPPEDNVSTMATIRPLRSELSKIDMKSNTNSDLLKSENMYSSTGYSIALIIVQNAK